jgi:hypothetical protein
MIFCLGLARSRRAGGKALLATGGLLLLNSKIVAVIRLRQTCLARRMLGLRGQPWRRACLEAM